MTYQRTLTTTESVMTTGHHTLNWVNHLQRAGYDEMYYQVNPLDAPIFISAGSTVKTKEGRIGGTVVIDHLILALS